jgi:hypothetical protein
LKAKEAAEAKLKEEEEKERKKPNIAKFFSSKPVEKPKEIDSVRESIIKQANEKYAKYGMIS